eukprot:s2006_g4.t1
MKTANLDNFDAIHEEVAKVMEKELDKCGSMKIMIQGEHDKGWEQVKMRMEQLQAAKQKIQEQKRAAKEKAEIHVKELDDAVAAAEAAAAVLKEAVEKLTAEGADKFKLEQECDMFQACAFRNSFGVEAFPGVGDMPSLKEKKSHDTDDVNQRRERKDVNPPARKPDRLDYSRFNEIGDDDRDERLQTGDVTWEELKKHEKQQVFDAREQVDAIIDQKRREEDDWKRQLKDYAVGHTSRLNEKPSDLSWVQGRHFASYEAFCVGRVESTLKKSGNEAFKAGDLAQAQADWEAGIGMILALGQLPDEAINMLCTLRNNLAQLHIKRGEWGKVKDLTDKILDKQPTNEKALYRRAQAFFAFSLWEKCEADLDVLLKHSPDNKEPRSAKSLSNYAPIEELPRLLSYRWTDASLMLRQVHQKTGKDRKKFAGKAVSDIAAGLAELCPDGTVRKLRIEEYGEGDPDEPPNWLQPRWLEKGSEKVVVTCQMVITSFGGEELYNSKEYRPFPETKQARDELKERGIARSIHPSTRGEPQFEAGKAPRLVGDFYRKVKKRPVRWYLGDPGMYKGFDLAARTMKPGERAIFEVDQPMLAASVEKFYESIGFHSTIAGLPQLQCAHYRPGPEESTARPCEEKADSALAAQQLQNSAVAEEQEQLGCTSRLRASA